jgi:hypothetical protein
MFEDNYWAHISPSGTKPWDFIVAEGYDYEYAGENLAKNFNNSNDVVTAWYNSRSHRENLLSTNYDEIGFGVVNGVLEGYETTLVVQMFGRPRDASYLASIDSNEAPLIPNARPASAVAQVKQASDVDTVAVSIDLTTVSRYILATFIFFLVLLMGLDVWYSSKKGIPKFTGHTFAHITFLIFILATIWLTLSPGRIL